MPKTNIYPPPRGEEGNQLQDTRIEIGWFKGRTGVTIATTTLTEGSDPTEDHKWFGQYVELTRYELNNMIRALRTARDQSEGKDE